MKKIIILTFAMACAFSVNAQEQTEAPQAQKRVQLHKQYPTVEISGSVVDAITGEALAGVKLQAYNNTYYTAMTGEDGTFTIKVPEFVTSISATLEGYGLSNVAINGRSSNVNIGLYSDRYLDNYIAKTTGSKSVKSDRFGNTSSITVDQDIQTRLGADVRTIQRSALPGVGDAMFINGYNSLHSNAQPLIILDGVIYDMMYDQEQLHSGYFNNLLSAINMDDIESVEVLKNGTAIYGAKAANGVIRITTKRVKSMATRIEVTASAGVELKPELLDVMDAEEYRTYASGLLQTTGTKLTEFKFLNTDPNYYYYNMYHNNTNWKDEVYREALSQKYGIAISGGDDIASYNLSVGYMNSNATLKKNDMNRFNLRFNTDIVLSKKFTTRFDASYTNITRNLRDDGLISDFNSEPLSSLGMLALVKSPFLSPYDFSTDGKESHFISDADTYLKEVLGSKSALANPNAILHNAEAVNKNHSDNTMINIAITPKYQINRNFSIQEHFAYTLQSFDERYYTPLIGMPDFILEGRGMVSNANKSLYARHNAVFSDTRFNWAIPLGAHRIDAFGGVRFLNDNFTSSVESGYDSGNDKTPNMSTSLKYPEASGNDNDWRSLTYYANVDYNYMEKYYLQGQLAVETSSRFGKEVDAGLGLFGVKWGIFPSIQGTWVVSNEKWFRPNNGVNMLKLNAGFESVGNDNIDNSATLTYMTSFNMLNSTIPGITLANIGNTKLRWETTNRFNVGLEGNFINNRLNVRFNYFHSKTNHLISMGTLAYVSGLTDYLTNDGALKNNGFDVALTGKIINTKNFKMELGASAGHYKNQLTALPEGDSEFVTEAYGAQILSRVGSPIGLFYGYKTDGVFADSKSAQNAGLSILDKSGRNIYFEAGDMKFVDQNGDNVINEADRVVIGDPNPDIYGNIFLNYLIGKHWTVNVRFNYSLGNDIYNYQRSILEGGSQFLNQTTAINRAWIAEGQQTDIPRSVYQDPMGNSRFSDRWIEDGSYIKLKNVTINYQLPIVNEYIQGISIWAAANNILTLSKYLGNDPEVSCSNQALFQGIDAGFLSSGRSFWLGIKINL
ncbi:MAG: SusC/RagA family TonB-linked outer membrane protein [Bacteroidaceae bacterium]|nr:SusC/RagA family TonB-linked outer membrane protein [Bacteroidaceae bacterium]